MIRVANPSDVPAIFDLINELAEYEKAPHEAQATTTQLQQALFGPNPNVFAHIATEETTTGEEVVGFALWFVNFSTWRGVNGIYLEDLYVRPTARGRGHGKALLTELARVCVQRGYGRLEWSVLDWNEPAIGFYKSLGGTPLSDWTVFRLTDEPLQRLGTSKA